ncbi:MAG TPA: tetratricopeptide repeat protein [Terriglobia bacterium]|nr:tetratricopeptide repeat protein [Terriglobia bacterium]
MAFDKAKTLQEANRYITQGKIAKAIKQYELAFEHEPSDLTLLNVIGDLYARENNVPEAVKCFYRLADAYTREGYKLKAISIYKKIVRLDRDSVDPLLRLAELSSGQGLAREARECFKSALDVFERKGQHVQSLEVLRKLCRLDPKNHSLRLHLAQAAERAGEVREAVEAYLGSAILARDNGDVAVFRRGLERAAELAPESAEVHLLRARQALPDKKPTADSLPLLQQGPVAHPAQQPHLPAQPVEFDLSQTGGIGDARVDEPELPLPKEISLDFHPPHRDELPTGGTAISHADGSAEMAPHHNREEKPEALAPSHFNFEEAREEVEFYLRHGFYQEAQKAVAEIEKNCPTNGQISELRRSVDQAAWESNPTEMPKSAPATDEQGGESAEWDLSTGLFGTASEGGLLRGNQASAASAADDGRVAPIEGELDSTLDGLCDPGMSPASSAKQAAPDGGPAISDNAAAELRSLLDEFGSGSESADNPADDEQTHYNLGVAFREMGLLDEAIGEFQKVVNVTGSKHFGPHFLQGCTLLASCFMDKEMPAIAAKWYLRALDAPGLDYEGTLAVYYDLGMAFEKAGDRTAALEKFTEVYSQNIDYRDVAEKIQLLRQTSR